VASMKTKRTPVKTRLFLKARDGVVHSGFVRAQRFYIVDAGTCDGDEVLVHQEGLEGTPTESGWYVATLPRDVKVHCRTSFPI